MIYGERIRLRAVEQSDVPRFVEWLNDPEVIAGLLIYLPMASWEETSWFEALATRPAEERPLAVDARMPDGTWTHIGSIGLHQIKSTNRSAEFGIFIGEKTFWNNGYGSEATQLALKHGFETLNLNRISLQVFETNSRAIHVYEKIGFILEGKLRQEIYRNGHYIDTLIMSILRSEWDAKK
ncbi:MAG: GNAT family protein [Chloroflexota bacterium]|jgi:RimJ/RimL family protein N-acetyltransferase